MVDVALSSKPLAEPRVWNETTSRLPLSSTLRLVASSGEFGPKAFRVTVEVAS
jgi:hypothetical protein